MSDTGPGATPRAFVSALLRGGAPEEPSDAARDVADLGTVGDAALARAWRYAVVGPLLYRIAAFPKVLIGYASANGGTGLLPVLLATVFAVLANLAAVAYVLRNGGLRAGGARLALSVDLAVGVLLNVAVAATEPAALQPFAVDVSWTWMVGAIGMWTCIYGVPRALLLVVAAIPLRALLTMAGGLALRSPLAMNRSIGCVVALVVAVVTAGGILVLLGVGARFALNVGVLRGVQAARRQTQRMLHDSVLQTLDALAMATPGDERDAVRRLAELRTVVRAEAAELRRRITAPVVASGSRSLVAELTEVATEMARDGLRTQLVAADIDDVDLSEARHTAMCDAVREALRNAVKHAGADQVVLRVEECDGGIGVVARDHGNGFDVQERPPGFGISQSIVARLVEVGGRGAVDSRPGHGTRVTMWVPR